VPLSFAEPRGHQPPHSWTAPRRAHSRGEAASRGKARAVKYFLEQQRLSRLGDDEVDLRPFTLLEIVDVLNLAYLAAASGYFAPDEAR